MTTAPSSAPPARRARRQHAVFHPLTVRSLVPLTDDSVAITFDVPEGLRDAYRFVQGQHLTLRLEIGGEDLRRNYSICAPVSAHTLRVAVKRLEGGAFSAYAIERLRPGDVVEVMTPTGRFFTALDPRQAKRYVAIAAGSGITPILSIIATTLEVEQESTFTLVYGNRTTSSVMFLEELNGLKDRYPQRLQLLHVLSREPRESDLLHGRIDAPRLEALLDTLVPPEGVDEWFLCGPFSMVEQASEVLTRRGADPGHVHTELFHVEGEAPRAEVAPADAQAPADASTVTVLLDGRATTFPLSRAGQTVLEAVLAARPDAPYACKGGVCGTCRAKLLDGKVRMERNYALEKDELDAGFVLACQSHPESDSVTLDFDA
jgi:ring-1,2-phenylacetyl-CoA epoxidase subunit PaaE